MFITFEGIEGSGKSTQAKLLSEYLSAKGLKVNLTREPGWGKLGQIIRNVLLDDREISLEPFAELCLFCTDRVNHVKGFIKPRLDSDEIVICDRYNDSTLVYQGIGRDNEKDLVAQMVVKSCLEVVPDITFLLDLPVQRGLERIESRKDKTKFDSESVAFHSRVRDGFLELQREQPKRIKLIDADSEVEKISEQIKNIIDEHLTK
ncbi:MAG: dTMP kinase [Candidatus Dadabacteria bacterium]|nr:dTMP kinase [Candidatus Dadabacteria bacterium]NIS10018.1 dTMP kinase [Candidatus Dadabacteria bacterium]NIV42024.1 dTMP kinase [Candidatus Dadabacteria bacterium]NIX15234.1 dTMP kinase [Candidatus Dadabacteria bacterium]NIY22990.1 dTMP kinase [Candidatus Dadabacteria bacterium]